MKIDFIKWLVGYAEGFEIKHDDITTEDFILFMGVTYLIQHLRESPLYPLLLQRAIEGINLTEESNFDIDQYADCIEIGCYSDGDKDKQIPVDQMTNEYDLLTFDQAKEEALKYIWERENEY